MDSNPRMNGTYYIIAVPIAIVIGLMTYVLISPLVFRPNEIEFILPDGFLGPFVIVTDPSGIPGEFSDGKLTIRVPASRIVRIRSMSAFQQMTHWRASFEDGSPLPVEEEFDPSGILLRLGGGATGKEFPPHKGFFVGTEDEQLKCDYRPIFRDAGLFK